MKLFAYAFAAASSSGVALCLMTEADMQLEINRMQALHKSRSDFLRAQKFLDTCGPYEFLRLEGEEFLCIDVAFESVIHGKYIRYDHLSNKMKEQLGGRK